MTDDDPALDDVVAALDRGGVVAVPTDTVYGIACRPGDAAAVERIYAIKQRPPALELSLLGADVASLETLAHLGDRGGRLAAAFWPGPLSIIVPVRRDQPLAVPRAGHTVSVRVPDHDLLRNLLRVTGPLASTSANRHGEPPATTAAQVTESLGDTLDAVLDGGPANGLASTIIDLTETPPRVLRTGPLSVEELRPYLGE